MNEMYNTTFDNINLNLLFVGAFSVFENAPTNKRFKLILSNVVLYISLTHFTVGAFSVFQNPLS